MKNILVTILSVLAIGNNSFAMEEFIVSASRSDSGCNYNVCGAPQGFLDAMRGIYQSSASSLLGISSNSTYSASSVSASVLTPVIVNGIDLSKGVNASIMVRDAITAIETALKSTKLSTAARAALRSALSQLTSFRYAIPMANSTLSIVATGLRAATAALSTASTQIGIRIAFGAAMGGFATAAVLAPVAIITTGLVISAAVGTIIYNQYAMEILDGIDSVVVGVQP